MADIDELRQLAQRAREVQVQVGDAHFTVRLPTQHECEVEALRQQGIEAAQVGAATRVAVPALVLRRLLERAVVAWSGITADMLVSGASAEPVEVSPQAVALLLDQRPQEAAKLYDAFLTAAAKRQQAQEDAEKN